MGDFNTGPDKGALTVELPGSYDILVDANYAAPYIDEQSSPPCTFCNENTLVTATNDKAIDHVFIRTDESYEVLSVARIMDETRPIEIEGEERELHLSDHYGVEVRLQWSETLSD